MNYLIIGPSKG